MATSGNGLFWTMEYTLTLPEAVETAPSELEVATAEDRQRDTLPSYVTYELCHSGTTTTG